MLTGDKRGRKPGTPKTGGRKRGTPNKRTAENALIAERKLVEAKAAGIPLGKEMLERLMLDFAEMAELYKPKPGKKPTPEQALQYERWTLHTLHAASELAPYQSPTLRAIYVPPTEPPVHRVTKFELKIFDSQRDRMIEHQEVEPVTHNEGGQ
jgi:hypothetical protein